MNKDRVVIAEIIRPRGVRGELLVVSQTDVPGRIEGLKRAYVHLSDGSDTSVEITEAWQFKGAWVLKFGGIDSMDEADRFRGADIWVPLSERGSLPEGEFFRSDLIGCSLLDAATGVCLGTVEGWLQHGGPFLLQSTVRGREVLIPFVDPICRKVDLAARAITVALPEGLLDL